MTMMMAAAALALAPLACATTGAPASETQNTTPKAGLVGKAEQYAGVALSAAKSYLSQSPPQQQDKQAAAQAGVSAANQQAEKQQGTALSQLEQNALLDWVKSKI